MVQGYDHSTPRHDHSCLSITGMHYLNHIFKLMVLENKYKVCVLNSKRFIALSGQENNKTCVQEKENSPIPGYRLSLRIN